MQLDGSPHDWLEGRGPHLTALGMQDDATGKILAAQFFLSESAEGYFRLLQRLLRRFGVPTAFYGDRSGIFVRNDPHWSLEEELAGQRQPTQFGRALSQLGITFIAAQSPQAKGRVERLWGVQLLRRQPRMGIGEFDGALVPRISPKGKSLDDRRSAMAAVAQRVRMSIV